MSADLRLKILGSLDELRGCAEHWDSLWRRSQCSLPTAQAEFVAQWVEQFSPDGRFAALVVDHGDCLLAALPLVGRKVRGLLEVGQLPFNCWSPGGCLLVDAKADADAVLERLATGIGKLPWPLLWLDEVELEGDLWCKFRSALWHADRDYSANRQFDVGLIDIDHDWPEYEARWSGNHRRAVRVGLRRLEELGEVELEVHHAPPIEEIEELLREGFEVEDRSWKGRAGTSVLRTPGMFEFFHRQACELARRGQLELYLLRHDGRAIAFEYCYTAKGVCYSHKIGYDPEFARFAPGLVLRRLQLERLFDDPARHTFNTLGILCEAKAKWSTRACSVGRLVAPTDHALGPLLMHAYRGWRHFSDSIGRTPPYACPKLGALPKERRPESRQSPAEPVGV